jgi:hypothetical protein
MIPARRRRRDLVMLKWPAEETGELIFDTRIKLPGFKPGRMLHERAGRKCSSAAPVVFDSCGPLLGQAPLNSSARLTSALSRRRRSPHWS